jgi:ent-kaurene oxidase
MLSKYTKFCLGHNAEMLSALVRCRLSQNLARLVPQLKVELESIVATEFPECQGMSITASCLQPLRTLT